MRIFKTRILGKYKLMFSKWQKNKLIALTKVQSEGGKMRQKKREKC